MNKRSKHPCLILDSPFCGRVITGLAAFGFVSMLCAMNIADAQVEPFAADMLLDVSTAEETEIRSASRWHIAHDDAIVSVHRVKLNTDAIQLLSPPPRR